MDLSALVLSFSTATGYAVTRTARGDTIKGRVVDGTITTVTVVASVSPASIADIERLPQGRQFDEAKVVITTTELKIGGIGAAFEADVIAIGGKNYEIYEVQTWVDSLSRGSAYRCLAMVVTS